MRLSLQLLISMSFIAIIAIVLTSLTSIFVASNSLEDAAFKQLSAVADGRRNQIATYFEGFDNKLQNLSRTELSTSALEMFGKGFEGIKGNPSEILQDLVTVERSEDVIYDFYDETGTIVYDAQHEKFNPQLNQFAVENSLGDLYLVNREGLIVYTAKANKEIGTNLLDGEFSKTQLGNLFRGIQVSGILIEEAAIEASSDYENTTTARDSAVISLEKFGPYVLSEREPAAFVGIPVFGLDNRFQGSIIAQISRQEIRKILNNRTGLGETGETVLATTDGTLLFDSIFTTEFDPLTTNINLSNFPEPGQSGIATGTLDSYRGISAIGSVAEVEYHGEVWKVVAIIDENEALAGTTTMAFGISTVAAMILIGALAFAFWFARNLTKPINAVIGNMAKLTSGNTSFELKGKERKDEVGDIVRSLETFREAAIEKVRIEEEAKRNRSQNEKDRQAVDEERARNAKEVSMTVEQLAEGLETLAAGDLIQTLDEPFMDSMEPVRLNFNTSIGKLRKALESIDRGASIIRRVSSEIASATGDLSSRTESQAVSLEEAAATMQELTDNVRSSAQQAQAAAGLASSAKQDTDKSAKVVSDAVSAMTRIEEKSNDIVGIINVIDEIAFQTNLLALNAGVEAARAGEAGKGFAVVAQEVRELASRSATAAKEIKELITSSNNEVEQGVKFVKATGEVLEKISSNVANINVRVNDVAANASHQLESIETVNDSVNEVDKRIQQNAAMAEETTAATQHLVSEIDHLNKMVGAFQIISKESTDSVKLKQLVKRMK